MKKITIFFILFSLLFAGNSINRKIREQKRELRLKQKQYDKMDKKLAKIAREIIDTKAENRILSKKLDRLEKKIRESQSIYDSLTKRKMDIDRRLAELNDIIDEKQDKFIALIADKFSMALVLEELKQPTPKSIILQEAYKVYAKKNNKELEKLKYELEKLNSKEDFLRQEQSDLEKKISIYKKDRDEYRDNMREKEKILQRLASDRAIYKRRFNAIREARRALQKSLNRLKIVKRNSEEESYEEVKVTISHRRHRKKKKVKVVRYRGGKTISPLEGSRLIKRFGTYIDPIYKFKIFNKSITLKAPYKGAKVKSVLDGKIVFAENSGGMLGKVVIIAHSNNIHTIYAKLSRLAPNIKVGRRVSKGSIIGKVNSTLMFEVTKNNKHLNPLKLIRL